MQSKLIALRKYNNFTQKEMSLFLNIDLRTYINKERGDSQFKIDEMFTIAQRFGMEIGEIFLPTNFMNHEVCGIKEEST
jgi:DNA-binding XRE family transcriptional regulator